MKDAFDRKLGLRVKELRKAAGLTQADLLKKTGISVTILSTLERGSRPYISIDALRRIAEGLGVPLRDLF